MCKRKKIRNEIHTEMLQEQLYKENNITKKHKNKVIEKL